MERNLDLGHKGEVATQVSDRTYIIVCTRLKIVYYLSW